MEYPELIGDYSLQLETVLKAGDLAVTRFIMLIRPNVIPMNIQNIRAVSLLDLSGLPVQLQILKMLLEASFTLWRG